ncbi:hypothetical protein BC938DRAFT_474782 [Jimgerdemannia flammicorona]|uniref:Uncharacterized protein n=1 Tax=Jimgerdemannia flammicorona TaxID=994334 RepID=A0A433QS90_9FUNG|nr:hypothetical protein BC938DRAFT_474782 [Jimgerdemannia flammicorona]
MGQSRSPLLSRDFFSIRTSFTPMRSSTPSGLEGSDKRIEYRRVRLYWDDSSEHEDGVFRLDAPKRS